MATKKIFLVIILFTVTAVLFGEELEFVTIRKTALYDIEKYSYLIKIPNDAILKINKGKKLKYIGKSNTGERKTFDKTKVIMGTFIYKNKIYKVDCSDLVPSNTINTFDPSFISDLNSNTRKTWVPAYLIAVLQSQDRDTILTFDKYWKEFEPQYLGGGVLEWFDYFSPNTFSICNSVLVLDTNVSLMIKNIMKNDNGYYVTVNFANEDWEDYKFNDLNWNSVKEKEFFNMILCIDGEYMDVYLDDMEHKLTTFALVDQIFLRELKSLVENKKVDLSKVHFPRRADGSIDNYLTSELLTDTDVTQTEDKMPQSAIEKTALPKNNADKTSLPLWAWFVFIGIAVAVSGGVAAVIVVLRKKAG